MAQISRFYGIAVRMFHNDHPPPHLHVFYSGKLALFEIMTGELMEGHLTPQAIRMVREWIRIHCNELLDNWERARAMKPLIRTAPLE